MQNEADSHTQYNMLYPTFVPNFKILGLVVHEKSLTKKKVYTHTHTYTHTHRHRHRHTYTHTDTDTQTHTHTHTHTHTQKNIVAEKTKTIYPLYTSYTRGIMRQLLLLKKNCNSCTH